MDAEVNEWALYITRAVDLKHYDKKFKRIYFGNEFCQRLIPGPDELAHVLDFLSKNSLDLTFVTPFVTNEGLRILEPLFSKIAREKPGSEVVFNDWGILRVINEKWGDLVPVMGRLLNKMKRGPRLINLLDVQPEAAVKYFQSCSIDTQHYRRFLTSHRVRRVELDNLLQGIAPNLVDSEISISLYIPYAYVTVTRLCLAISCETHGKEDIVGIFPCKKECQKYTFHLVNPVMPVPLIRKGNTIFFKNDKIPEDLGKKNIDRIIFEPEVPL